MQDGLNNKERELSWIASFNPSLNGIAIVNKDLTFRSANDQFCKILGVTRAELIGQKFTDITPEPVKSLDLKNANLVKEGKQDYYFLPKMYEMKDGRRVEVLLLVVGVYQDMENKTGFLHFVSLIMMMERSTKQKSASLATIGLLNWIDKKKVGTTIALSGLAGLAYYCKKYLGWEWLTIN